MTRYNACRSITNHIGYTVFVFGKNGLKYSCDTDTYGQAWVTGIKSTSSHEQFIIVEREVL